MVSADSPDSPPRSGDDETPTQQISPDEDLVPARPVAPDDALKASLLGGNGGKIGRFHVLRLLGEGGMGMVFAGYDEELGRKVAIKLLRKVASEDSIGRARLLREAQTLARLSHPNVVTVYEVGEFGRQVYIAMEFVLGETLQSYMQSRRRSWRELIAVFVEAGRGLAVAHAAGILHRDFKPKSRRPSQTALQPTDRPHSRELGRFERVSLLRLAPRCPALPQVLAKLWQRADLGSPAARGCGVGPR